MTLRKVLRSGRPLLRQRARQLQPGEWEDGKLDSLVDDMIQTMRDENGVGLAAPQVQVGLRLLVYEIQPNPRYPEIDESEPARVLINPRIIRRSSDLKTDWEGCLSYPDLRARVPRHHWVEVEGIDRAGEEQSFRAEGFEARVIQHEIDHLDGALLVDRVRDTESIMFSDEYRRFHAGKRTETSGDDSSSD